MLFEYQLKIIEDKKQKNKKLIPNLKNLFLSNKKNR